MKQTKNHPQRALGLAANGSSRKWDIAVDETLDGKEWSLEIDSPQAYLVFQLREPKVVSEAAHFLQSRPGSDQTSGRCGEAVELNLGRFGAALVSLVWDDEDSSRCFLIIGVKARSTLRLTLEADDIQAIREALNRVLEDMPTVDRP